MLKTNFLDDFPYGRSTNLKSTLKSTRTWFWRIMVLEDHLGGGNSNIFYFDPGSLGKSSNLTIIFFSDGLKPPTRKMLKKDGFGGSF